MRTPCSCRLSFLVSLLAHAGCGASEVFEPPDTRVVGHSLGAMLALAYAGSLGHHAFTVGESPCYETLRSCSDDGACADVALLQVDAACGFPFPGRATGQIVVASAGGQDSP